MATFVTMINLTQQGMAAIQESAKRAEAFKARAKKMGVKVKELFWTLGSIDGLAVLEAPDEETVTALTLSLGAEGNVHTQTLRAFTATEMDAILKNAAG